MSALFYISGLPCSAVRVWKLFPELRSLLLCLHYLSDMDCVLAQDLYFERGDYLSGFQHLFEYSENCLLGRRFQEHVEKSH
jgi:hypothetical protein